MVKAHASQVWRWSGALLGALLLAGWLVTPVLAHGGTIRWDGDPAHLIEDLLVEFGLPVVILGGGALVGWLLSRWLARRAPAVDETEAAGDEQRSPRDERPLSR